MAHWEFERILNEVEFMLRTINAGEEADPESLYSKANELYKLLTDPHAKPIRLSLFIEGYKDSDNLENDFTFNNGTLVDFIRYDSHKYITERLKIQLAYYFCRKHLYICRLYLYYLDLITNKTHQILTHHKVEDYDILRDLSQLQIYCINGGHDNRAMFMSSIANRITQEYLSEYSILPF